MDFSSMYDYLMGSVADSLREDPTTSLPINDIDLLSVLDKNGIVQVNPWIIRLVPATKRVYVTHARNLSTVNMLASDLSGVSNVEEYGFDDPVFELLNDSQETVSAKKKSKPCAASYSDWTDNGWVEYCNTSTKKRKYYGKIEYSKAGIKEKMWIEFYHREKTIGNICCWDAENVYILVETEGMWVTRDGSFGYMPVFCPQVPMGNNVLTYPLFVSQWKPTLYESTRCLEQINVSLKITMDNGCLPGVSWSDPATNEILETLEIKS
jgi:hypothetical protein